MYALADTPRTTLLEHGIGRLRSLLPVLGFSEVDERRITGIFRTMGSSWGKQRCGHRPRWFSDICDDHSPFELSVALDGAVPELRILAEIQAERPTMCANWEAALAYTEELAAAHGLSLDRFWAIQDLFKPTLATPRFGLWHAVCFRPGGLPELKLYLNPAVRGRALGRPLVEEALFRLGFVGAAAYLPPAYAADRILYFGLDLTPRRSLGVPQSAPRVKVYTAHFDATPECIEGALRAASGHVPGQVAGFCRAMGAGPGPFEARPVQTCLSFTAGDSAPTSGTVYFPVRAYADSDLEVRERVRGYIHAEGAPFYERALEAFANRPLESGVGMQSYVSLRQAPGPRRLTVYLAPEVYSVDHGMAGDGMVSGIIPRDVMHAAIQQVKGSRPEGLAASRVAPVLPLSTLRVVAGRG